MKVMIKLFQITFKKNSNFFIILLNFILFFNCNITRNCSIEDPFLKGENCVSTCTTDEINSNICELINEIIETQWLNNIIDIIGEGNFVYVNIATTQTNDLFLLSSTYPESNVRLFYLLNYQGYGFLNEDTPKLTIKINETYDKGRFESEIFTIKLYDSNDGKEYLISISKSIQYVEIYDFYTNKIYIDSVNNVFEVKNSFTKIGVHLKLKSAEKEHKNSYLIGLLAFDDDFINSFFYLKKVNFISLDIANSRPQSLTQKTESSLSSIVSCYETDKYFIICFYKNKNLQYSIIVYNNNLEYKNNIVIMQGSTNNDIFFKCIHYFGETGVFAYFPVTEEEKSNKINLEFKIYFNNNNTIENQYKTNEELPFIHPTFIRNNVTLCDIIKVDDKKFIFAAVSFDKDILFITSYFNYKEEEFTLRQYKIYINNLYNYVIYDGLRLALYNNFLAICSTHLIISTSDTYGSPFLIIFNYAKTLNNSLDLKNHIYINNDKIYNLTLELTGNYIIENNIFGYIYSGIQIIENCINLNNSPDIYLADLSEKKIKTDYFVPKNEKIKLIIPRQDTYEPFFCEFVYATVLTEPEYLEYNKYPYHFVDTDQTNKEDEFFENTKKNYVGKYSYYKLYLNQTLTEKNCIDNCELCLGDEIYNNNECIVCKNSFYFDNNIKICEYNNSDEYSETTDSEKSEIIKSEISEITDSEITVSEITDSEISETTVSEITDSEISEITVSEITDNEITEITDSEKS